jgi:hypothetical protein
VKAGTARYFFLQRHGFDKNPTHVGLVIVLDDGTNFTVGLGYGGCVDSDKYDSVEPSGGFQHSTYWESMDFLHLCPAAIYSPDQLIDPLNSIKNLLTDDGIEPNNYSVWKTGIFKPEMLNKLREFSNVIIGHERINATWEDPGVIWHLDLPYRYSTIPSWGVVNVPPVLSNKSRAELEEVQALYKKWNETHLPEEQIDEINCCDFGNRIVGIKIAQQGFGPLAVAAYNKLNTGAQKRVMEQVSELNKELEHIEKTKYDQGGIGKLRFEIQENKIKKIPHGHALSTIVSDQTIFLLPQQHDQLEKKALEEATIALEKERQITGTYNPFSRIFSSLFGVPETVRSGGGNSKLKTKKRYKFYKNRYTKKNKKSRRRANNHY